MYFQEKIKHTMCIMGIIGTFKYHHHALLLYPCKVIILNGKVAEVVIYEQPTCNKTWAFEYFVNSNLHSHPYTSIHYRSKRCIDSAGIRHFEIHQN